MQATLARRWQKPMAMESVAWQMRLEHQSLEQGNGYGPTHARLLVSDMASRKPET